MPPPSVEVVGIVAVAIVAATAIRQALSYLSLTWRGLREPPGPRPLPLIGNLLDLPMEKVHVAYSHLAERYGPIMKFTTPASTFLVLSSAEVVQELLDKRGSISGDRPPMHMATLTEWGWGFGIMRYGSEWRARRRIAQQYFDKRAIPRYELQTTRITHRLIRSLSDTPEMFMQHIRHASAFNILRITYGIDVETGDDPYVKLADHAMEVFAAVVLPGVWPVDWIPALKYLPAWFPGAYFKRYAEEHKKYPINMRDVPYAWTKSQMEQGIAIPCLVSESLLTDSGVSNELDKVVRDAAGFMYLGGVDTVAATVQAFLLAITLHPSVQRAAQEELDRVVGLDRLPTFSDRESLPYIEAIILEVLRLYSPAPLGMPHALEEDDVYNGMYLRKGTMLVANAWAILHNPQEYPNPHSFSPDRFIHNGRIDKTVQDPRDHIFGYGRRICPGIHFADATLFIQIATILACFEITKEVENGAEITPSGQFQHSALSAPLPFRCSIKPRSEKMMLLVAQNLE